jgi:hypothetical protein
MTSASETYDPGPALSRLDGDEELLREVVELVQEEWLGKSAEIEDALARSDGEALAAAAHFLKGAVAQLFPVGGAEGLAQLEGRARAGDLAGAAAVWRSDAPHVESLLAAARRWAGAVAS